MCVVPRNGRRLLLAEVMHTSGGGRTLGSTKQDAGGGGRARAKPQPKNGGELAAAAPRGRASARAVSVKEEGVHVVARALVTCVRLPAPVTCSMRAILRRAF